MAEPSPVAPPNSLNHPQEQLAVRVNHDAGLHLDHLDHVTGRTLSNTEHSPASTYVESGSRDRDAGRDVEMAEEHSLHAGDGDGEKRHDPNIVHWDGPDDLENPTNWSTGRKYAIVAIISSITFLTYSPHPQPSKAVTIANPL